MPPKKKMDNWVYALENRMSTLEVAIVEMRAQAVADQERLISLITQIKDVGGFVNKRVMETRTTLKTSKSKS